MMYNDKVEFSIVTVITPAHDRSFENSDLPDKPFSTVNSLI